jgi:hypothetical protein
MKIKNITVIMIFMVMFFPGCSVKPTEFEYSSPDKKSRIKISEINYGAVDSFHCDVMLLEGEKKRIYIMENENCNPDYIKVEWKSNTEVVIKSEQFKKIIQQEFGGVYVRVLPVIKPKMTVKELKKVIGDRIVLGDGRERILDYLHNLEIPNYMDYNKQRIVALVKDTNDNFFIKESVQIYFYLNSKGKLSKIEFEPVYTRP